MMNSGKMTTIARPYAAAAFEYAASAKDFSNWNVMLEKAAYIAADASVMQLLCNPQVSTEQLKDLFCDILKPVLNTQMQNFIWLLAENNRLVALPDIAMLFKTSLATQEKTLNAEVVSAVELDKAYQQKLTKALTKRFERQVELSYQIDPTLLGGVIVRAGDMVIDGSVRGKLTRLLDSF
ncbi:MAG: F0F1 ATP synthase subunit delta [Gammaproteobacteria bacterium]|nr:F0F1 ATP synthase subunit delta [Gammaproteobacteria bacterium]